MFDRHLKENNVGYFKHLWHAVVLGVLSITAGLIFLLHAVFPFVLTHNGSDLIKKISARFFK